ncbi:hypothetical protein AAG570_003644 [Ranatra chinensis]|uniref:Protein kinase domain-containing protein n=1 Tax=Ranatra chinensis TaxID=642074 RepID=A0ABD0Y6H6_9HEMI
MVAIKIVSKFHAPDEYLRKFLPREIESVKGLAHPNLIRFIQAIESTHRVYIIMEYAEKGTLLEMIRKEKFIEEERSRKWFRQLVDVVQYCHNKGVVHRDIKCDNLLINGADLIKLSDFGFARDRMTERNGVFPLSETYCGSYAYAAPEILNGVPYYAQMADVWSMGIVLYAMVFGKLPFDDTNIKILLRQVQHKVMFPRSPQVSKGCKGLITKILAPARQRVSIGGIRADPWFNKAGKLPEPPGYPSTSTANPKVKTDISSVVYDNRKVHRT